MWLGPFLFCAGCGGQPSVTLHREPTLLRVTDQDQRPIQAFAVRVTAAGELVAEADCPDWASEPLSCEPDGVLIPFASPEREVAIRAHGYHFTVLTLQPKDQPLPLTVELLPMADPVSNEQYATGFVPDNGWDVFGELAVQMDTELGPTQVIKWLIRGLDDVPEVYFQNTHDYPLHYTFNRVVLGDVSGLSEFEARTYQGEDRVNFAGSLTYYPQLDLPSTALGTEAKSPLVVGFFPSDDLGPDQALQAHQLLEERLGMVDLVGGKTRLFYAPAGEIQETALAEATLEYSKKGAAWLTHRELYAGIRLQLLNDGIAYGTLRELSPEQLESDPVSSRDVVLLTRLPNSIPVVAGTITEELQTPLAHVNVAARSRGTPNIAWLDAAQDSRVQELMGELVRFEVGDGTFTLQAASLDEAQEFWTQRQPPEVTPVFDDSRDGLPNFDVIGFADSPSIGSKAANLAELHQLLEAETPFGFAVPFSHYRAFMDQGRVTQRSCDNAEQSCRASSRTDRACRQAAAFCSAFEGDGETLSQHVARLVQAPELASNTAAREAALFFLRTQMMQTEVDTQFARALNRRVVEIFASNKIRLRSSTNTEDLPTFSGAGLYESVSAYGDKEPLASDRIRQVWASVWAYTAFEEREYWNIDHLAVRMGCAVNPAYTEERANGVLITRNLADPKTPGMYVNVQKGEVSVTNPTAGALPEVFSIITAPQGIQVARQRYSSLSPDRALLSDAEILALYRASTQVAAHFTELYGSFPDALPLDLEFKFHGQQRQLIIKQVRPYAGN